MNTDYIVQSIMDTVGEVAAKNATVYPLHVDLSIHDDEPGNLFLTVELSTCHLFGFTVTDAELYTDQRARELEALFTTAAWCGCSIGKAGIAKATEEPSCQ